MVTSSINSTVALSVEPIPCFVSLMKRKHYSDKAIIEIWKWYDYVERKGVNFG